ALEQEAGRDLPFRQLAQHLPTPCWISDAEGLIVWVNDAWMAYTGKDPETLLHEGLAVIHDPEVLPRVRQKWAEPRGAGGPAGVGVWEWRLATNEMIYSPRAREISGFDPEGPVTYEMVAAVTHPEDFPRTSAQAARALDPQVRDHAPYEYRIVRPSGEVRWVTASGEAIFEPDAE